MSREQDSRYMVFLEKELQQRTEQLAISQEHVSKLQDQLRVSQHNVATLQGLIKFPETKSDHQLAADIEAINSMWFSEQEASKYGFDLEKAITKETAALREALENDVMRIIDREMRIGGILNRRG